MANRTVQVLGLIGLALLLAGCSGGSAHTAPVLLQIGNGVIAIAANASQFAGAVSSIVFNGRQFVNSHDHGRLFQTAVQVDGYGECHNPTEAGCAADFGKATSSSKLLAHSVESDFLATEVQAASWGLAPDGLNFCPKGADPRLPAQPTRTIISKSVECGTVSDTNVVAWRVNVKCPDARETLGVEILTGYLPAAFQNAFTYDAKRKALTPVAQWVSKLSPVDGYPDGATWVPVGAPEQHPVVWATPDGQHAVAAVRPANTVKKCEQWAYHLFRFDLGPGDAPTDNSCVKFSVVTHAPVQCLGADSDHLVYLIFGTLDQVHQHLNKIK